jgi:suppressor of tumorigenicity protein 13
MADAGDEAPFPPMSPEGKEELTDAEQDKQNELKQAGTDALEDGKKDVALEKFSEAVAVGCASAMLYSRRAQLLLDMGRPKAAANDCSAALAVNPDSAKAFKIRARANIKLELLKEAHSDFCAALKIDYDEDTDEASKEVAAKVKELQAKEGVDRHKAEKEEYERKLQESKVAYEAGLAANEEKFREERMKEEEEKKKKEDERKERVRKREEEDAGGYKAEEADGVPKAHAPPEPTGAEDVD